MPESICRNQNAERRDAVRATARVPLAVCEAGATSRQWILLGLVCKSNNDLSHVNDFILNLEHMPEYTGQTAFRFHTERFKFGDATLLGHDHTEQSCTLLTSPGYTHLECRSGC